MNTPRSQGQSATNVRSVRRLWPFAAGASVLLAMVYAAVAIGQTALPPLIDLPSDPLYMNGSKTKANLTLALSVEFPTVGQTYRDEFDITKTYVGYFDNSSCYKHVSANGSLGAYFDWTGAANANGSCGGGGFNGNFMNWATSSAVDILRYGLTGGNRVLDEGNGNGRTILQRAWLPDNFYRNGSYFTEKRLPKALVPLMIEGSVANKIGDNDMYIYNCRDRVYFAKSRDTLGGCTNPFGVADAKSDQLTGPNTNDTFYSVRALTCDPNSAKNRLMSYDPDTKRWRGLCLRYSDGKGSGFYKPVGQFQVNSESMRIGVLGYLQDDNRSRYGGVLRSPLKYLGPRQFDENFNLMTTANPHAEWSPTTGVFIDNPQSSSTTYGDQGHPLSGATMYINKFGTLDSNNIGRYKTLDPVSELYYEAIRYLQGKQPSAEAVSGVSGSSTSVRTLKENFPVYTNWTDPFANFQDAPGSGKSCLRNSVLTIADVFTHSDRSVPGNPLAINEDFIRADGTNPALNTPFWTNIVGSFEANGGRGYKDSEGRNQVANNIAANSPYLPELLSAATLATGAAGGSYHMAGLAYWANTQSFRAQHPRARVTTYTIDVNENRSSDNLAFRKKTQLYLAAKYGGFDDSLTGNTGNPYANGNLLWLGTGGDPQNYFIVSDAQKFLDSLADVFADVLDETGSIAGGAVSSQRLQSTQAEGVFQARFNPEANYWSGRLGKYELKLSTDGLSVDIAKTPSWEAAAVMTTATKLDYGASRNIIIGSPLGRQGLDSPVAFQWSNLPSAHQLSLSSGLSDVTDTLGIDRVAYLRGDQRKEQTTSNPAAPFRHRDYVLGSIVNSGLVYQGAPALGIGGDTYLSYYTTNKLRRHVVFANANDGMLHAFYADTGKEAFAYIPGFIAPRLKALPDLDYSHRSLVDATPAVGEAYFGSKWRSVLVSGVGGGGQGIFALDTTNPATFGTDNVLWEFTDKDHPALGNVMGRPEILKIRTTNKSSATPEYKWFAVVPGGINNYAPDGSAHATGDPSIFLLDLAAKPSPTSPWTEGVNYWRIKLPQTSTAIAKGIVNLTSVKNFYTGALDHLYAGDLQGNVWKLNFTENGIQDLGTDAASNLLKLNGIAGTQAPMFVATAFDGKLQPITTSPSVLTGFGGKPIVMVGTGKYMETSDLTVPLPTRASIYALLDESKVISGRSSLVSNSVDLTTGLVSVPDFAWGSTAPAKPGWYADYSQALGERQISESTVIPGKVFFGTIYPTKGACGEGGGNFYALNPLTGDGSVIESPVGILARPIVIEFGNTALTRSDTAGQRTATKQHTIILQGSKGIERLPSSFSTTYTTGRISWRQVNNFRENAK